MRKDKHLYCPWTKKPLTITKVGERWMALSPHGWYSKTFLTRELLEEWLKGRDDTITIEVREIVGPATGMFIDGCKKEGRAMDGKFLRRKA